MIENNHVNYNNVLSRFKINYDPGQTFLKSEWKNECFEHLYEALLKADLSLRETLMIFDKNLDGKVSFSEFEQVLKDLNISNIIFYQHFSMYVHIITYACLAL